jgi:hypothetical protein
MLSVAALDCAQADVLTSKEASNNQEAIRLFGDERGWGGLSHGNRDASISV